MYSLSRKIAHPLFRASFRITVRGLANLPKTGSVILVANHQSFCDSLFLPVVMDRPVTFLAKAEYFDRWSSRVFMEAFGQIPIRRGNGPESIRALALATELLESGSVLALYPEGTRSRDGAVHRGHAGAARLALETGAAVVPIGLSGTEKVQPVGSRFLRPMARVGVTLGVPRWISAEDVAAAGSKKVALKSFTEDFMREIARLSNRPYIDVYLPSP